MAFNTKRSFNDFISIMSERNNYQYDYSLISEEDYNKFGSDRLIQIICNVHGPVMVHQGKHSSVKGCKCPECIADLKSDKINQYYEATKIKQQRNIDFLISTFYGDKTLYNVYLDNDLNIHIDCVKHGNIRTIKRYQSSLDLTTACQKCTTCRNERLDAIKKKKKLLAIKHPQQTLRKRLELLISSEPEAFSFAELIDKTSSLNRDTEKYSYSYDHEKINKLFRNYKIPYKIPVTCNKHGEYISVLESHLQGKSNCQVCAGIARISKEECLKRFKNVHGDKFDYSKFKFKSMGMKSIVRCIKHDHWFKTTPSNHLICETSGGCKLCNKSGFDISKPGTLYYISINNGQAYKIGITNHSVKKRFLKDSDLNYKVIATFEFDLGIDALNRETEIKRQFKHAKYIGEPLLLNGNTELFSYDILGLDTSLQPPREYL